MTYVLNAWERFTQWQYWWMHMMVLIWLFFSVMLFVMEPRSRRNPVATEVEKKVTPDTFHAIQRKHLLLLSLGLLTWYLVDARFPSFATALGKNFTACF